MYAERCFIVPDVGECGEILSACGAENALGVSLDSNLSGTLVDSRSYVR